MLSALVCGALVFPGLFCSSRKVLKSTFTQWSDADVVCVSERLVSAIHASLATAAGVTVMTSCRDVMADSHWLVNAFVLFGVPYMVFDIYAMYLSHYHTQKLKGHSSSYSGHSLQTVKAFLIKDSMLVLHHMALLLIFMPITLLGLDNTRLHRINGIIVLLSFFTCRILLFPFMYWMYGRQFGIPLHRVVFHLPLQCNVGNLVLLAPQIYWFILLLRKANRLYLRQRKGPARKD
ncbi:ceramide synthase-like isoform X3 [Simochromis diagramma]|uniref:ceramide synthase-like isoform X3 n=1 Tax=Simochromis diagramma TaxID=43689 RepID=UPI001A7E4683|nr:ceramide synthase-like isoform X3 [Simochromis diagramma]